jgi:hypothetical protein
MRRHQSNYSHIWQKISIDLYIQIPENKIPLLDVVYNIAAVEDMVYRLFENDILWFVSIIALSIGVTALILYLFRARLLK